jgi:hypothetical protein
MAAATDRIVRRMGGFSIDDASGMCRVEFAEPCRMPGPAGWNTRLLRQPSTVTGRE